MKSTRMIICVASLALLLSPAILLCQEATAGHGSVEFGVRSLGRRVRTA